MSPRARDPNARFQSVPGDPPLEKDSRSGVLYVRKTIKGRGTLFKSTGERKIMAAREKAREMIDEFRGRKPGLRPERIRIRELCELALEDCLKQTQTLDEEGFPLRRMSTYMNNDKAHLRGPLKKGIKRKKGMRKEGVIRELFGDFYADEIDEQFWKTWVKRKGRGLGRKLNDIAKYLSLVLSFAFDEKYIARKPEFFNPDKHKKKATKYTDDQVLLFFNKAEPTLKDLIIIRAENPLRGHETAEVHWTMVRILNQSEGPPVVEFVLPESFVKANARTVRLTRNAAAVVVRRWHEMMALPPDDRSPYVFPAPRNPKKPLNRVQVNRMWRRMKKAVGVAPEVQMHFNWFRHNVYNRLRKIHGVDISSVSQVGGTSIRTLQKHYDLEEEESTIRVANAINLPFHRQATEAAKEEE